MGWDKLNNHELQAMRKMLMLDVSEAAELIGNVSNRTWQYWEAGRSPVPEDVDTEIYALKSQLNECIDGIVEAGEENNNLQWYHTFEEFLRDYPGQNKVWWKLHQAVCAELFANEGDDIELRSDIKTDKSSHIYKFFSRTRKEDVEYAEQERIFKEKTENKT